jgi:hypothetical protein
LVIGTLAPSPSHRVKPARLGKDVCLRANGLLKKGRTRFLGSDVKNDARGHSCRRIAQQEPYLVHSTQ